MMPTHIHIVVRAGVDPTRDFDLVEFRKFTRSNLALFLNAYWDGSGGIFCRDSVGDSIKILDCESELDQLLYVECNGAEAGLGKRPEDLKGAISQRAWLTEPVSVKRPEIWFQKRTWGDEVELKLCVPSEFAKRGTTAKEFQKLSSDALDLRLRRIRKRRQKEGKESVSLDILEIQDLSRDEESSVADHSRALMVGTNKRAKALEYHNYKGWWAWHRAALSRLQRGEKNVVFPPGTYMAAKKYGARVASGGRYRAPIRRRDEAEGVLEKRYARQLKSDSRRIERIE